MVISHHLKKNPLKLKQWCDWTFLIVAHKLIALLRLLSTEGAFCDLPKVNARAHKLRNWWTNILIINVLSLQTLRNVIGEFGCFLGAEINRFIHCRSPFCLFGRWERFRCDALERGDVDSSICKWTSGIE